MYSSSLNIFSYSLSGIGRKCKYQFAFTFFSLLQLDNVSYISLLMKCMEVLIKYITNWNNTWIVWTWLKDKDIENEVYLPRSNDAVWMNKAKRESNLLKRNIGISFLLEQWLLNVFLFFNLNPQQEIHFTLWPDTHICIACMCLSEIRISWNKTYYISYSGNVPFYSNLLKCCWRPSYGLYVSLFKNLCFRV